MNPLDINKTNTTRFIIAMLFKENVKYEDLLKKGFINSYTSDFYKPEHDGTILIVKKTKGTLKDLTEDEPVASYKRGNHYIFVYNIPYKYIEDYMNIVMGNFSEVSDDYKEQLLSFWNEDKESSLDKVLNNKDETLKKIYTYKLIEEMYNVKEKEEDDLYESEGILY